ncbi:MAG TPA: hypothetical protein VF221_12080 [Chloroflexota bacterium]
MTDRDPGSTLPYRPSCALAILLFTAAVTGLFFPGIYRDSPDWAAQARGVNLVDLLFALPTLIASLLLSARGSRRARVVWLGVLGYVLYNAVIVAFTIAFNPLFLVYVGLLSLSVFTVVTLLTRVDVDGLRLQFSRSTPVRSVSLYLMVVAALFFLAWMKDIIPAVLGNTTPTTIAQAKIPTNPVYVLDLAFLLPLYVLSAIRLQRGRGWGYLLAGILLVLNSLLSLSIVSSTFFQYANDRSVSLGVVPLFGIITVVSVLLASRYFQCLHEDR